MRHIPRFYCPDLTLALHATVSLPEAAAHHAKTVLRVKEGGEVKLFNPADGEWRGVCHYPDKRSVQVTLSERIALCETLAPVALVLAPLKNKDSFDSAIRHAIELGVTAIHLVQTAYTQQTKINKERLQQQIIDAVQQCGRLSVPDLHGIAKLETLLATWPRDTVLLPCVEGSHDQVPPLGTQAAALAGRPVALLIGPEGGFSPAEKQALTMAAPHLQPVSLGALILRSDTAVAAALALLTHAQKS